MWISPWPFGLTVTNRVAPAHCGEFPAPSQVPGVSSCTHDVPLLAERKSPTRLAADPLVALTTTAYSGWFPVVPSVAALTASFMFTLWPTVHGFAALLATVAFGPTTVPPVPNCCAATVLPPVGTQCTPKSGEV